MTESTYVRMLRGDTRLDDVNHLIGSIKDTADRQALVSYTSGMSDGIRLTARKAALTAWVSFIAGILAGLATSFII